MAMDMGATSLREVDDLDDLRDGLVHDDEDVGVDVSGMATEPFTNAAMLVSSVWFKTANRNRAGH